ncbi:hypothetical protein ASF57_24085 [Methylobacterium sp. Leaf117]|nr:hypothetical protein ASF57_24085 [Methylobacterium sp. Leaf117]
MRSSSYSSVKRVKCSFQFDDQASSLMDQLGRHMGALRLASQVHILSAASATITTTITLPFLTIAILVLASVAKLAAHPTIAALFTLFAETAPIIDFHTARAEPETLRKAGGILE